VDRATQRLVGRRARVAGRLQSRQGELRRSFRYADGAYHDEHQHAILADEAADLTR
jgi:hypothetical protein